jgi:hypothetical protein
MRKSSVRSSARMQPNSCVNMTMALGASQNLLACRLTKAVWWYRPSPGEGKPDCQSLFVRLDWSEEIANPSPLGSQGDSRAKWVGKTGFYRSSGATAFVEWSSTVYSKTSEIGVSDAPTDRSDLRRLNRLNELSPAMTLSGMRRLSDSDRSPAFSLLVPHPCSCTRGRSVGACSSVRRAGRLRIANGHARHRISGFTRGRWVSEGRTSQPSVPWQKSLCVSVQPPTAPFSDWNAPGLDPQGLVVLTDGMSCPALSGPQTRTPPRECDNKQGDPWVPGTSQGPIGFLGNGDVMIHGLYLVAWSEGNCRRTRCRACSIHKCCGSPRRDIATRPVWTAPTGTPLGSALAANRDLHRPLAAKRNPPGFLGKGDVMIHRPCLVAWSVGSDWRTRRPRQCPSIH